jgi:predicted nucleic acid-binding protein
MSCSVRTASVTSERHEIGLLDTSVIIDLGGLEPARLPVRSRVSTITLAELGLGLHTTADPAERALRAERLQRAESVFDPLAFTVESARRFSHLAGLVIAAGRSPKPRRLDLMIAAVASANQVPLYTRNPDDFAGLESVLTTVAV